MRLKLAIKGLIKMVFGVVALGLLLFLPAGTFAFPGAWRMILILFIPAFILGSVLLIKNPVLLEKRLNSKEKETEQKSVILFSALMFILSFVLCGLDFRFSWIRMPLWLSVVGCILFLLTYLGFVLVLRQNEYLSRTIEIQEDQKVVDTGMYGIVRHPMYMVITFMYISMPLVIGSYIGLIPLLAFPVIISKRIKNEEKVLEKGLPGYIEYEKKVRYRMIPFVW